MNDDEYTNTQLTIFGIYLALRELDLNAFLARISKTHALAPILDPTLYRAGVDKLQAIEDIAQALAGAKTRLAHIDLERLFPEKDHETQ